MADLKKKLLKGVYSGKINRRKLPKDLYQHNAQRLEHNLVKGYGGNALDFDPEGREYKLFQSLRDNIYAFSGAKTYQQVREMEKLVMGPGGKTPWDAFEGKAGELFDLYNKTWQMTEEQTVLGQARSASKWNEIERRKGALPLLRYSAIEDANTSDICSSIDGTVRPVDDDFWDSFSPLNHYNCRCILEQLGEDSAEVTDEDETRDIAEEVGPLMAPVFKVNPGRSGEIFDKNHPYFDIPDADKGFAKRNFGLKIPDDNE